MKEMYFQNKQYEAANNGGNNEDRLRSEEDYIQELKEQDKSERIQKLIKIFGQDQIDTTVLKE